MTLVPRIAGRRSFGGAGVDSLTRIPTENPDRKSRQNPERRIPENPERKIPDTKIPNGKIPTGQSDFRPASLNSDPSVFIPTDQSEF